MHAQQRSSSLQTLDQYTLLCMSMVLAFVMTYISKHRGVILYELMSFYVSVMSKVSCEQF